MREVRWREVRRGKRYKIEAFSALVHGIICLEMRGRLMRGRQMGIDGLT